MARAPHGRLVATETWPRRSCAECRVESRASALPRGSLHLLDVRQLPALVEVRFGRAVEAEDREPAAVWQCLDPVLLLAGRQLRAEVDVDRSVRVLLRIGIHADRGQFLAVLQLGPAQC